MVIRDWADGAWGCVKSLIPSEVSQQDGRRKISRAMIYYRQVDIQNFMKPCNFKVIWIEKDVWEIKHIHEHNSVSELGHFVFTEHESVL